MNLVLEEGTKMNAQVVRTILAFCVCASVPLSAGAQISGNTPRQRAQALLGQLEQQLAKIKNYRCRKVTPLATAQGSENPTSMDYRHEWLSADSQGRGRVTTTEERNRYSLTWDGDKTIEQRELTDPNGVITHMAVIVKGIQYQTQRQNEPWVYLGSDLANLMTQALANRSTVRVSAASTGHYRLDVRDDAGQTHTALLDPKQGYAPVYRRLFANGKVLSRERTTFQPVPGQPGIWFPFTVQSEVDPRAAAPLEKPVLKCTFTNVEVNTWEFESIFRTDFAEGTRVEDRIQARSYVVDDDTTELATDSTLAATDVNEPTTPADARVAPAWQVAFERTYHLNGDQALRCIAPPFIPERAQYLLDAEPTLASQISRAIRSRIYAFQWNETVETSECVGQNRRLPLSAVLDDIIGLSSYQYEGLPHLLRLPLAGDWIVRRDTPTEQRLALLEPIIKAQTQWSIQFVREQAGAIVIRTSGDYRFAAIPEVAPENGVQIYVGRWDAQTDATDSDCGTLAEFLEAVAHNLGMQIIDETQSSQVDLCWTAHRSAALQPLKDTGSLYNTRLAGLLSNLARQTGLIFQLELGSIERWRITTPSVMAARSN